MSISDYEMQQRVEGLESELANLSKRVGVVEVAIQETNSNVSEVGTAVSKVAQRQDELFGTLQFQLHELARANNTSLSSVGKVLVAVICFALFLDSLIRALQLTVTS